MSRITLLCLGLAVVATSLWSPEVEAATPVQYTSRTRFRIPYRFDPAQMQRIGAQEIRLFLSRDRGSRWLTAQTVSPRTGRFDFQAPEDGEYWFAVRTVDARNQLHPRIPVNAPELQVIVDTTRPELSIQLTEIQPGRVGLAWQLSDQNLDPSTLRLEYRDGRSDRWQQVVISPKPSGNTAWTLAAGGMVQVRGSVQDLAGNTGTAEDS
ncbi:MAG: hypothetical protein KDA79_11620, partial [Planctomycetaceae bacterium]|nr:hypothetical protein [Planctomycetaceae bacterium]